MSKVLWKGAEGEYRRKISETSLAGVVLGPKREEAASYAPVEIKETATYPNHSIDAFIDADKESYIDYYELCLRLLRPGGLILVDNVLWGGRVADPGARDQATEAIRRFNLHLKDDARVDLSMIPVADGLTLARKR